jgi:hypothetical protein
VANSGSIFATISNCTSGDTLNFKGASSPSSASNDGADFLITMPVQSGDNYFASQIRLLDAVPSSVTNVIGFADFNKFGKCVMSFTP